MADQTRFSIDQLIKIVNGGGKVKTGVDVFNSKGILLLDKDVLVEKVRILEIIKENGIDSVVVEGGLWDENNNPISDGEDSGADGAEDQDRDDSPPAEPEKMPERPFPDTVTGEIETRLVEIEEIKAQAREKYKNVKGCVKKIVGDIKETGGEFDYNVVESHVGDMVKFLQTDENPFSYLAQEIFSFNDYLYNHSINVLTTGTTMLNRFNTHFSNYVDHLIKGNSQDVHDPFGKEKVSGKSSFFCYYKEDLQDIALGFFLHDIGKVLVADEILNKEGKLTKEEYEEVRRHSYEYGVQLLEKNRIKNAYIQNIVKYHHAPLIDGEERCYPPGRSYSTVPLYTKICKLADIYDAMTSKRCYGEAVNPISVVTTIFRTYAKKDPVLQFLLHSFVKSIGIYPPGSIVYLRNGQMAYVLESKGPIVIPFTDSHEQTLNQKAEPIDINSPDVEDSLLIDSRRSIKTPKDVFDLLPPFLRGTVSE